MGKERATYKFSEKEETTIFSRNSKQKTIGIGSY